MIGLLGFLWLPLTGHMWLQRTKWRARNPTEHFFDTVPHHTTPMEQVRLIKTLFERLALRWWSTTSPMIHKSRDDSSQNRPILQRWLSWEYSPNTSQFDYSFLRPRRWWQSGVQNRLYGSPPIIFPKLDTAFRPNRKFCRLVSSLRLPNNPEVNVTGRCLTACRFLERSAGENSVRDGFANCCSGTQWSDERNREA